MIDTPATTPIFTAAGHDDRYWLDRTIGGQTSVMVHGPFRCLADACVRANEFNRENFGLESADA